MPINKPIQTGRRQFVKTGAVIGSAITLAIKAPIVSAKNSKSLAFDEYRQYDAMGLSKLVRKGDASPKELLDIAISRAEAVQPTINAITLKHYDLAYDAIKQGLPKGPLSGVPYLLKDLGIAMQGTITTEGSVLFKDARNDYDSTLVARYRQAGLVIFGKTHSPEFGGSASTETQLFGATRNPWDLSLSSGGSSGGAAAAVAAGIIPAAHASDGGGSIRIPASACGLVGMKPTRGRVPMGPKAYETREGCSAMHAVSRSVRDSALLLDISQGGELGDAYASPDMGRYLRAIKRSPTKLRIALMTSPLLDLPVATECVTAAENTAKLCESLGHQVEPAKPTLDATALHNAFYTVSTVLTAQKIAAREAVLGRSARPEELEKLNGFIREASKRVSGAHYAQARSTFHQASRTLAHFMKDYDVILSPTMAITPPKIGVLNLSRSSLDEITLPSASATAFTSLYNMTGQPAVSLPLHWTKEDVPVGTMFAGRFGDETTLFRLAAQLEEAAPWFDRLPPV